MKTTWNSNFKNHGQTHFSHLDTFIDFGLSFGILLLWLG